MSTSSADRALIVMSAAVALFTVAVRVHDIVAYPALHDFDAAGHALNVVDLFEGRLPNLHSWSGNHPPLYHALGALLWILLPAGIPVHVMLRGISMVSSIAAVALVWGALRRIASAIDAAVVAALLLGVPGLLIASCMMTNDALCALLVTATLVRLLPGPQESTVEGSPPYQGGVRGGFEFADQQPPPRPLLGKEEVDSSNVPAPKGRSASVDTELPTAGHAALTGVLAGLAALTKTTGLGVVAVAVVWYAWRSRHSVRGAVRNLLALGLVAALIAGPHYARALFALPGSFFDFATAYAGSQEKRAITDFMLTKISPQQVRLLIPVLFHLVLWGDPVGTFLPHDLPVPRAMLALLVAGLCVLGIAVTGAVRLLARPKVATRLGAALAFGTLISVSLVALAWQVPHPMAMKATPMLAAVFPMGLLLVFGIGAIHGAPGVLLRGALLAVAASGAALTWYGWWLPKSPAPPPITLGDVPAGSAEQAVDRYFQYRAYDPIRALPLLDAQVQRTHGLQLARILGVSVPPEGGMLPAEEDALELARARVAWMELYNLVGWLQPASAALAVTVLDAHQGLEDASVTVRISAGGMQAPRGVGSWPFAPFEQHFTLQRHGSEWRITAIDQRGVMDENAVAAFAASPTAGGLDRMRALGCWRGVSG
jgi:hypothetical protein